MCNWTIDIKLSVMRAILRFHFRLGKIAAALCKEARQANEFVVRTRSRRESWRARARASTSDQETQVQLGNERSAN